MTNKKISLYTEKEEKELEKLMNQFDKKEINSDHFHIKTNKYNFPYLMDSEFYSEGDRQKFWEINKNNNK